MGEEMKCNNEQKEETIIICRPRCGKLYIIKNAKELYAKRGVKNECSNEMRQIWDQLGSKGMIKIRSK